MSDSKEALIMRPARVHPASLIQAVHHIVWSTNAEGRLRFGNSAWSRLIGFPCGVDVEAALAARIHFSDRKRRSEQWQHALDSREPYEVEYRLELSEGKAPCWYLEQGTPVRVAEDGLPVGWAVIATPIGAGKRREEDLLAALRRRDDFFAVLLHELRNPLTPIAMALQLLDHGPGNTAMVGRACGIIQRQVHQLTRLVDDLLDISRIAQGDLELQTCDVDLQEVLDLAIETARPLVDLRNQVLAASKADRAIRMIADPVRLGQVLTNLLINAAKYTPPGGHISVCVQQEDGWVRIVVRDNGTGVAPERLAEIFQLFRHGTPNAAGGSGGLGVGLAVARQLVELHGGTIEARSEGIGKGTEFAIRLPRGRLTHTQ